MLDEAKQKIVHHLQQNIQAIDAKLSTSLDALKKYLDAHHLKNKQKEEEEGGSQTTPDDQNPLDYHALQLVLQYRLNNQDILKLLFQYQQSLWQILDICPANTNEVNYERLAYALGNQDLHLLLSALNQLVEALVKLIERNQKSNKNQLRQSQQFKRSKQHAPILDLPEKNLRDGLRLQKEVIGLFEDTQAELQALSCDQPFLGLVLDDIAALGEPISRFYLALEHGFELSGGLFQQMSLQYGISASLTHIIDKLNNLGQHLQLTPAPVLTPIQDTQKAFSMPEHRKTIQTVEEEASRLRLSNFFQRNPH